MSEDSDDSLIYDFYQNLENELDENQLNNPNRNKNSQNIKEFKIDETVKNSQNKITIEGIDIYFPYEPYPSQIQ